MTDRTVRVLLTGEAKQLLATLSSAGSGLKQMGGQAQQAGNQVAAGMSQAEQATQRTSTQIQALGRIATSAFAAISVAAAVRSIGEQADAYTGLRSRVELFAGSQDKTNATLGQLFDLAQRTRAPLMETGSLYVSLAGAAGELNASQQDLIRFTGGVNAALALNNTATAAAAGGLLQLSQMMGGPIVQAQEFNSLIDSMRPLLVVVAKNLEGAGGSVSKLKQMVNEGKVSTRDFFAAALAGSDELTTKMASMQSTMGQSLQRISNAWTQYIATQDQSRGASASVADALNLVADNFGAIADGVTDVGAVIAAVLAGRAAGAMAAFAGAQLTAATASLAARREELLAANAALAVAEADNVATAAALRLAQAQAAAGMGFRSVAVAEAAAEAASVAHTAAVARQAAAVGAASVALNGFRAVLSFLGGPIGLITLGLTALTFWFMRSGDEADKAGPKMTRSLDDALARAKQLQDMKAGKFTTPQDEADIEALGKALDGLQTSYDAVMRSIQSGESARAGRLAGDAAAADQIARQMQQLRDARAAIEGAGVTAPTSAAAPVSTAAAEAAMTRLKAALDAAEQLAKAVDEKRQAALDEALQQQLISDAEYYQRRGAIEQAAAAREINQRRAELAQLASVEAAVAATKPKDDNDRDQQAKKLADIEGQRLQLQGQINALKEREQTINIKTRADTEKAAADMDKRVADARARLAQLQGDAAAIAATTREQLQREFADVLKAGTPSQQATASSLIDFESAKAEFDALKSKADGVLSDLRSEWDSLSQSVQAGTVGTAQAQATFSGALESTNPEMQGLLDRLRQLAQTIGPDASRQVQSLSENFVQLRENTRTPLEQLAADWSDTSNQIQQAGVSAMRNIADALTDTAMGAKRDFLDLATSIIRDLVRIMIQAQLTKAALALGNALSSVFSPTSAAPSSSASAAAGGFDIGTGSGSIAASIGLGSVPGRADGGPIVGPGTSTSDSVLIRGSNGEYVFRAEAVRSLGRRAMDLLNRYGARALDMIMQPGQLPAYASGGPVGDIAGATTRPSRSSGATGIQINVPLNLKFESPAQLSQEDVTQLGKTLQAGIEAKVQQIIIDETGARGMLSGGR